jgi:antitoxin MazE
MRARISKWGNSLAIRLPKAYLAETELGEGDEVEVSVADGRIIITPSRSGYALEDLVKGITAENRHTETDWGAPTGAEVW